MFAKRYFDGMSERAKYNYQRELVSQISMEYLTSYGVDPDVISGKRKATDSELFELRSLERHLGYKADRPRA